MTIHTPAFSHKLTDDVRENVRQHRTFAELVAQLGAEHEAHVSAVNDHSARLDALGARLDAALNEREKFSVR